MKEGARRTIEATVKRGREPSYVLSAQFGTLQPCALPQGDFTKPFSHFGGQESPGPGERLNQLMSRCSSLSTCVGSPWMSAPSGARPPFPWPAYQPVDHAADWGGGGSSSKEGWRRTGSSGCGVGHNVHAAPGQGLCPSKSCFDYVPRAARQISEASRLDGIELKSLIRRRTQSSGCPRCVLWGARSLAAGNWSDLLLDVSHPVRPPSHTHLSGLEHLASLLATSPQQIAHCEATTRRRCAIAPGDSVLT